MLVTRFHLVVHKAWVMRLATACLLALTALSCSGPGPAETGESGKQSRENRITEVVSGLRHPIAIIGSPPLRMTLEERLRQSGATGISIAVVQNGQLDWARGFGTLSADSEESVTVNTLFQAASISKPLTALATLRLVQAGELDLDANVNDLLTTWQVPDNEFTAASPVTIRGILSHSAGFTNGSVGSYAAGEPVPSLLDALHGAPPSDQPPATVDYLPGSRTVYSGGGYSVLQQLLIDVTAKPFDRFMAETVLQPLGMGISCMTQPLPSDWVHRAATGHDRSGHPIPGRWETLPEMAAGGLWSTAAELAQLPIALHAAWNGVDDRVLSAATVRLMMTPVIESRGLGFEIDLVDGQTRYQHTGSNRGYRAILVGFLETGNAAIILNNGDNAADLRYEILRSIAQLYGWPGYEPTPKALIELSSEAHAELEGLYDYGGGYATTIFTDGGRLLARITGGSAVEVFFEAPDRAFSLGGVEYSFVRESGAVSGLTANLGSGTTLSARKQ